MSTSSVEQQSQRTVTPPWASAPRRRRALVMPWLRRFLGAFAFAYAAALVLGVIETFVVVRPSAMPVSSLGIATAIWAIPAAVLGTAALFVSSVLVLTPRLRGLILPGPERLPRYLVATFSAAVGLFVVQLAAEVVGGRSPLTQRIAMGAAAFGALLAAGVLFLPVTTFVSRVLARLPQRLSSPGLFVGPLLALIVAAFLGVRASAPDYFRELGWQAPAALLGVFLVALLGTVAWRGLVLVAMMMAGLSMGVMAWHYTTPPPARARQQIQRRGVITPFLASRLRRRSTPRITTTDAVAACRPGQELTPVGALGELEGGGPDIVLITIDALRWDHTSMAEVQGRDLTPRLASHASRAAVFERAYTVAPSTRQSFRSSFTGIIPGRVGAPSTADLPWALSLVPGQPTIASYLAAAGYETIALISKKKAFPEAHNGLQGFSEIDDSFARYHLSRQYTASVKMSSIIARLARPPEAESAPRFLWTHLIEPHYPYRTGPELPARSGMSHHNRHMHSVRYVDQQIDRLLRFLSGRERKNDTWVFITADHGEAFREHGTRHHGSSVFEEEIHVPLLIWGPDVTPGTRSTPVSLIDLAPTIIAASGLSVPEGLCGRSLLPSLLEEDGEPEAMPIYSVALPDETRDHFEVAWIDGDQKLIIHASTGTRELFDLDADPDEENNLLEEDEHAADELVGGLRAFYRAHGLDPADYSLGD